MKIQFGDEAHEVPPGVVIGLIGDSGSGVGKLLEATPSALVTFDYSLDARDAFGKAVGENELAQLRRRGCTILLASHDQDLLRRTADEVWWVDESRVATKGDPRETIDAYRRHVADRLRRAASGSSLPMEPSVRRGDGRAELIEVATLDASGLRTAGWHSGEEAVVRVSIRYCEAVRDPVVGIMIRTRIGMEVYGTNTELENVTVGPCEPGETRTVDFRFACNLCPQSYTITAASHDPDGVWHDWLEDAVAFSVTDDRYTAGVANLRARVTCSRG